MTGLERLIFPEVRPDPFQTQLLQKERNHYQKNSFRIGYIKDLAPII
jgi:hypothetical protein